MTGNDGLPQNWGYLPLDAISIIADHGRQPVKANERVAGPIPYCGANGVIDHVAGFTHEGDFVLLAEDGGFYGPGENSAYVMSGRFWANNHVHVLRGIGSRLDNRFLCYYLAYADLRPYLTGATRPKLTQGAMRRVPVLIPYPDDPTRSVAEQRRIVTRLEALLGEVREMRQLQAEIEADVGRLMESVLAEVFTQYSAAEMKPVGEIAEVKGGKRLPKGEDFAAGVTEHPYLRVTDFRNFSIDRSGLRFLKPETYQKIQKYTISSSDIYISIAGTIGLVGTIPPDLDGANLTENAAKLVFKSEYKDHVDTEFLVFYLASLPGRRQIEERSKAAGQPKLALMRIETIAVPVLGSLPEQQQIVSFITSIWQEIEQLHSSLQQDRLALNTLERSFLAQAFRGEL